MVLIMFVDYRGKWRDNNFLILKTMVGGGINHDPGLIIDIQFPSAYSISPKAED
jgi:hypothetical protein